MKKIFVIDRALVFLFVAASFSGIGLHAAGHGGCHAQWHNWAVGHVAASLLFFVFAVLHVKMHWGWYKARIKNGVARKEMMTTLLSLLFLLVSFSGFILLGVRGANSGLGLWHYKTGVIVTVVAVCHVLKRAALLRKLLK